VQRSFSPDYFFESELVLAAAQSRPGLQRREVKITLNGFPEEIQGSEVTIQDLLDQSQEDDPAVIVEVNGRFVYRKDFKTFKIGEGDRIEFIHPSFGG